MGHLMLTCAYLRPKPCLALREALRAHASAAMDVSDGLVLDASRMCAASGVDGIIEAVAVPFAPDIADLIAKHPQLMETALTGGDDYVILAAIRSGEEAAFEAAAMQAGVGVTRIGQFNEGQGRLTVADASGERLIFGQTGYDHFQV